MPDLAASHAALPIGAVLPRIRSTLVRENRAVLVAPPGAGKTTVVPLALLDEPWLDGKRIIMLEPRRLAARNAARRMASLLWEQVGMSVGYRIRLDSNVGPGTRIEVVTEGVLVRMLQADPELQGVGCVLFDEFHERRLHSDLGLALCLDAQDGLRPDLRLVVMSATLDAAAVAELMGGCPVIESLGRAWPVDVRYMVPNSRAAGRAPRMEDAVAACVRHALATEQGGILVFLPGSREIRRTAERLADIGVTGVDVHILHGDAPAERQDAAIAPAPAGRRKVVLSSAIAETSLTIEDVRIVIDAGWSRTSRFDTASGMSRLVTERVSLDTASQRAGRSGRLGPGICFRLWSQGEEVSFRKSARAEILEADLASLVLELSAWGVSSPDALRWLDMPSTASVAQARELLSGIDVIDGAGRLTRHGAAIAALPLHPRLANMVLRGAEYGWGSTACLLAALLEERDSACLPVADMGARMRMLLECPESAAHGNMGRIMSGARKVAAVADIRFSTSNALLGVPHCGMLVALAYPERIAQALGGGEFRLACGRRAFLLPEDALAREGLLAVAELDGDPARARIWRAAILDKGTVERCFGDHLARISSVKWDQREERVVARCEVRLGAVVLESEDNVTPDGEQQATAVLEGIRHVGLAALPWTDELRQWQARVMLLRAGDEAGWPDVGDANLEATLEVWLAPFLSGVTRKSQFKRIPLGAALAAMLPWDKAQKLDAETPTHLPVPSGSRVAVDYTAVGGPVLAVKLQELFGLQATPVVGGNIPVTIHLLSPAGRPLQVTRDLAGFWRNGYQAVRSEMRGRYPKHPWPENPLAAQATRHTKKRAGL